MRRRTLVLLRLTLTAALVLSALFTGTARAALTVNTTTDSNAPGGCEGGAGDCSLRQAIAKASPGDTVNVPSGTYSLSLGNLGISQALNIEGAGARSTSVVASGSPHIFVVGSADPVTISGLTISAGHVTGTGSDFQHGGAVYNVEGSVLTLDADSISGTTLEKTDATSPPVRGGGIANNGNLSITNSTVSGNVLVTSSTETANQGAGLFNSGGTVSIVNSTIAGNSQVVSAGAKSSGSGIANVGGGTVELLNVTIAGNTGSAAIDGSGTMTAKNTIVSNGANGNCSGPVASLGHNLESADECGFHAAGDQTGKDPLLGALGDNGGPDRHRGAAPGEPRDRCGGSRRLPGQRPTGSLPASGLGLRRRSVRARACDCGSLQRVQVRAAEAEQAQGDRDPDRGRSRPGDDHPEGEGDREQTAGALRECDSFKGSQRRGKGQAADQGQRQGKAQARPHGQGEGEGKGHLHPDRRHTQYEDQDRQADQASLSDPV